MRIPNSKSSVARALAYSLLFHSIHFDVVFFSLPPLLLLLLPIPSRSHSLGSPFARFSFVSVSNLWSVLHFSLACCSPRAVDVFAVAVSMACCLLLGRTYAGRGVRSAQDKLFFIPLFLLLLRAVRVIFPFLIFHFIHFICH